MNKESLQHGITCAHSPDRRNFHRKSICDARLEFSHMDSRERIIEASLLTAIGTLGITCGFSSISYPANPMVKLVSRGLDGSSTDFIEKNFTTLLEYFPLLENTTSNPFHGDLLVLQEDNQYFVPLNRAGIRILIGWRMGKEISGLMGFGPKIISDTYVDDEINFLLNLTDNMIYALMSVESQRIMQKVKMALAREKAQSADLILGIKAAKKDLNHTRFRLSGFNDIFNELSGLKESTKVIDSFLLVLMGIFSASGGYVFHLDQTIEAPYMACRGIENVEKTQILSIQVQAGIGNAFASISALQLSPMQATILSLQQMDCFKPFLPETAIGLIFKVDETAMGVIGLNERLTQTPYGPDERELLYAFAKNFMVFLKNSRSFETIERLNKEQGKRNIELQQTIKALSESRGYISRLEKTSEQIRNAITRTMAQSKKISLVDISLILITGIVLGLVYNFASPGGINVIPKEWLRPSMAHVDMAQARQLFETQKAIFVDARPSEFFKQGHIAGAQNLSPALFDFIYMMRFAKLELNHPIVVYGRNISRRYDEETAFQLLERGHKKVMIFAKGIEEWEKKGLGMEP